MLCTTWTSPAIRRLFLSAAVVASLGSAGSLAADPVQTRLPFNYAEQPGSSARMFNWSWDGLARSVIVIQPTVPVANSPLIVVLHPLSSNGLEMANISRAGQLSAQRGATVIVPYSVGGQWNDDPNTDSGVDDVGFLTHILDNAPRLFGTDPRRQFFMGYSNGGFMSGRMACEIGDRIAGIGVVAATLRTGAASLCPAGRTMPVTVVMGTADRIVPYTGSGEMMSVDATRVFWGDRNGCTATSTESIYPKIRRLTSSDRTSAALIRPTTCTKAPFQLIRIDEGGHNWPGAAYRFSMALYGAQNDDIAATDVLGAFFGGLPSRGP